MSAPAGRSTIARLRALTARGLRGVRAGPSRFGRGDAVWWGETEIAHAHPRGRIDARLRGAVQREAAAAFPARGRRKRAQWIEVAVRGEADLRRLARLLVAQYRTPSPRPRGRGAGR